jgi:ribosome-binding factor A
MPREFLRSDRVAGQLRRELARLIQQEVKDPAVGFISVSDVEVSRDLSHARVYVTVFDSEEAPACIKALNRAGGFLRNRLGKILRMRLIPELSFLHDASVETGRHVGDLIDKAVASDRKKSEPKD